MCQESYQWRPEEGQLFSVAIGAGRIFSVEDGKGTSPKVVTREGANFDNRMAWI